MKLYYDLPEFVFIDGLLHQWGNWEVISYGRKRFAIKVEHE